MRGIVAACALAALGCARAATVCGPQEFPVSVQSDPTIYCVASRPCSGDYSLLRQIGAVGACPNGAGCALLPQAPNVMGCVKAGLADVSYVNADGSLTRNGAIVAANADTTTTTTKTTKAVTKEKVETATNGTAAGSAASATTLDSSSKASTPSAAGTSSKATEPADGAAPASVATVLSPSSTSGSMKSLDVSKASVANQQSVDDINRDGTSKTKSGQAASGGLGPTVGILVGCLAIVAVVAGVFVLRRAKESGDLETPQEGMNEYGGGNGVMTPRDQVQLL